MKDENDLPKTLLEATRYFADPDVALGFMVSMRWPDGIVKCPRCNSLRVSFTAKRRVWTCEDCPKRQQFSIKVGTIMEDSPIGLDKWIVGMWLVTSAKNGISSYELHRALGITQKSAWFLGHRIRFALTNGSLEKMNGMVEADETFIGAKARNMHFGKRKKKGTGPVAMTPVMGLLERTTAKRASRVVLKVVFSSLVRKWKSETSHLSVMAKRYKHKAYQEILSLRDKAIPLILKEMQRSPDRWFDALEKLSGEDPAVNAETFYEAVDKWIAWGVAHEHLECEIA